MKYFALRLTHLLATKSANLINKRRNQTKNILSTQTATSPTKKNRERGTPIALFSRHEAALIHRTSRPRHRRRRSTFSITRAPSLLHEQKINAPRNAARKGKKDSSFSPSLKKIAWCSVNKLRRTSNAKSHDDSLLYVRTSSFLDYVRPEREGQLFARRSCLF